VSGGEADEPSSGVAPPPGVRLISKDDFHGWARRRVLGAQGSSGDEVAEVVVRGKYCSAGCRTAVPWRFCLFVGRYAADEPEPQVPDGQFASVMSDDPSTLVVSLLGPGRHSARDCSFAIMGAGSKLSQLGSEKHDCRDDSYGADGGADSGHPVQR
jgi:hypothetical protein